MLNLRALPLLVMSQHEQPPKAGSRGEKSVSDRAAAAELLSESSLSILFQTGGTTREEEEEEAAEGEINYWGTLQEEE